MLSAASVYCTLQAQHHIPLELLDYCIHKSSTKLQVRICFIHYLSFPQHKLPKIHSYKCSQMVNFTLKLKLVQSRDDISLGQKQHEFIHAKSAW